MRPLPRSILLLLLAVAAAPTHAATPDGEVPAVAAKAMTILRSECYACHNPEKKKGGLLLTSREGLLAGGENGPVVVPGKPGESVLFKSLAKDADSHMPPKKQLPDDQIAAIRAWIDAGAAWDSKAFASAGEAPSTRSVVFTAPPAGYQPVLALAVSPDQMTLAAGIGNRVRLHDLTKPERPVARVFEGARDAVQSLAWSRDGKWLAGGDYGRVLLWRMDRESPLVLLEGLSGRVTAVQFTPDGNMLLAADGDAGGPGRLNVFAISDDIASSARPERTLDAHKDGVMAIACNAKRDLLATGGGDKIVRLWQLPDFKKVGDFEGHSGRITSLAFSPDGSLLASGSADRELKVWDVETRQRKVSAGPHPQAISGLWWGKADEIVVACEDGSVRSAKPDASAIGRAYTPAGDALLCVAATSDGKAIFAGGYDGKVSEWGPAGKVMPVLPGK